MIFHNRFVRIILCLCGLFLLACFGLTMKLFWDFMPRAPLAAVYRNDAMTAAKWVRTHGPRATYREPISALDETPLHAAVRLGKLEIAAVLLDNGADPTVPNTIGISPMMMATYSRSGDATLKETKELIELFRVRNFDLAQRHGRDGMTILHYAAYYHRETTVQYLLQRGIAPNVTDDKGQTPLHYLFRGAYFAAGDETVKVLLQQGARVDCEDENGESPLDFARRNGCAEALLKLVELSGVGQQE